MNAAETTHYDPDMDFDHCWSRSTCAGRVAEVEGLIAEAQHAHENEVTRHA